MENIIKKVIREDFERLVEMFNEYEGYERLKEVGETYLLYSERYAKIAVASILDQEIEEFFPLVMSCRWVEEEMMDNSLSVANNIIFSSEKKFYGKV